MPFARPFATKGSVVAAAAKRLITIYRGSFRPGGIYGKDGPLLVKQGDLFRQGIDQRLEQFDEASALRRMDDRRRRSPRSGSGADSDIPQSSRATSLARQGGSRFAASNRQRSFRGSG